MGDPWIHGRLEATYCRGCTRQIVLLLACGRIVGRRNCHLAVCFLHELGASLITPVDMALHSQSDHESALCVFVCLCVCVCVCQRSLRVARWLRFVYFCQTEAIAFRDNSLTNRSNLSSSRCCRQLTMVHIISCLCTTLGARLVLRTD